MHKRSLLGLAAVVAVVAWVSAYTGEIGNESAVARRDTAADSSGVSGAADAIDPIVPGDPFPHDDPTCPSAAPVVSAQNGWRSAQASRPAFETLDFEIIARPEASNIDALVAVGNQDIADFSDAAIAVRFADDGLIDARDGSVYDSDVPFAYEAGIWYSILI